MKEVKQEVPAQRILGRTVGREISAEEAASIGAGGMPAPDPEGTMPFVIGGREWAYGDWGGN
ncbi:hypothetical protein ACFDR9_004868 [Janthinobacterium sp. CG_23.3]|uniref:hypothetical protein n=1 Tax=unclassified Janthinobacterium TaxID=2610881 RepID=UPI0003748A77|nr:MULTISPECIES: hypothetical protein [unclassified Janthinobacterium]MEC5162765.1 hypothetical protein [Janthinobacterium sp. CG_S6]